MSYKKEAETNLALANRKIEKIEKMIYSEERLNSWLISRLYTILDMYRAMKMNCEKILQQ